MIKTFIISFLLVVFAGCSSAFATSDNFSDTEQLNRWITYYYSKPEPLRVADAISAASSKGLTHNGQETTPFIGFIAGVINKTPSMAQHLAKYLVSLPHADQHMVILSIWYSSYPDAEHLLQNIKTSIPQHKEIIDKLLANNRPSLLELPMEKGPWVLDMLWGYFMATGDEAPVVRIITALPWINIRDDTSRLLVGGAARWSLTSNATQHERVMAICRKEVESQPDEVKTLLQEVITSAENDIKQDKKG
ncbi:MAG: hypothetical protein IPI58_02075 [Alphaproteobacteria bacterium]|nr:MAG: hypothetical protein IPI58_02075 [Alphaproteobacteria bacterium]